MLSYPAVKEPVDAHRDAMLVHFYATEQVAMGQTVSTLGNHAIAVCEAAKKVLKKAPGGFRFGGGDHDPDEQDHGCPACGAALPLRPGALRLRVQLQDGERSGAGPSLIVSATTEHCCTAINRRRGALKR